MGERDLWWRLLRGVETDQMYVRTPQYELTYVSLSLPLSLSLSLSHHPTLLLLLLLCFTLSAVTAHHSLPLPAHLTPSRFCSGPLLQLAVVVVVL